MKRDLPGKNLPSAKEKSVAGPTQRLDSDTQRLCVLLVCQHLPEAGVNAVNTSEKMVLTQCVLTVRQRLR